MAFGLNSIRSGTSDRSSASPLNSGFISAQYSLIERPTNSKNVYAHFINNKLVASYSEDPENITKHIDGPYYADDLKCLVYLTYDVYGNKPIFSTSDGTRPGFGTKNVYVEN